MFGHFKPQTGSKHHIREKIEPVFKIVILNLKTGFMHMYMWINLVTRGVAMLV